MSVVGIITEYNPFHNGHKYHIERAKKITGADYVIAVMSGNFVQRGHPSIMDKYTRSMMALSNEVDIIIELPVCYATSSAEFFALGAVTLLDRLGIVDYICFGSESGDIKVLEKIARIFNNPSKDFQDNISSYLKEGLSFPAARAKATAQLLLPNEPISSNHDLIDAISEPNNILGIEYIKALDKINSSMIPITISRKDAHYHDKNINYLETNKDLPAHELITNHTFSSATAIRGIIEDTHKSSSLHSIKDTVPNNVYNYFTSKYNITYPITIKDFESIIKYKLLSENNQELSCYQDLSSDMADRIKNLDIVKSNIHDLIEDIKTKNITLTRVNRALIHVLLNIKSHDMLEYTREDIVYYARILGMKKEASHLIRKIKNTERLPVITKVSKAKEQLDPIGMKMLNQDIFAAHLYNQAIYEKYNTTIPNEYKQGICIL